MRLWIYPACDFRRITEGVFALLLQDHVGLGFVAAGGQNDGGREDKRSAEPGIRAEVFTEQFDAQVGAERGLDVEEDASARCGDMMDAPVPKESSGGGAGQAADGQSDPGGRADMGEGRRRNFLCAPRIEKHRAEDPHSQHDCSRNDAVGRDHNWTMRLHQLFAEENPAKRGAKR